FLFGSADITDIRRLFNASPMHDVQTPGYYIGRHEVTYGQWIEFLDALPPDERRRRSPSAEVAVNLHFTLTVTEIGPARWRFAMTPTTRTYRSEERRVGKECRSRWS